MQRRREVRRQDTLDTVEDFLVGIILSNRKVSERDCHSPY